MSLKTILEESKSKLTALLSFANETTGQSDTNIGDAIRTLCGGYGGGGNVIEGSFTPTTDTNSWTFEKASEKCIIIVFADDLATCPSPENAATKTQTDCMFYIPFGNMRMSSSSTEQGYISIRLSSTNGYTGVIAGVASGSTETETTVNLNTGSSAYKFIASRKYNYIIIPFTE